MTIISALITVLLCTASCVALAQEDPASVDANAQGTEEKREQPTREDEAEAAQQKVMERVRDLIDAGKAADTIPLLDGMLDDYAKRYPEGTRWYVARTPSETLAYMVQAASAYDRGTSTGSKAVSLYVLWAEA